MILEIKQKYWSIADKFALTDANGRPLFYAQNKVLKLRGNLDLYNIGGALVYHMEAKFMHMFSYFDVFNASGARVGFIDEKIHWPSFRRAEMKVGGVTIKIKGGPIHMKALVKGADGKWQKDKPAVYSSKKVFHIADTYVVQIDERLIDPALGALVALWYDRIRHGKQH